MEKKRYKIQFAARFMVLLLVLSALFTAALGIGKTTAKADSEIESFMDGTTIISDSSLMSKVTLKNNVNAVTTNVGVYIGQTSGGLRGIWVFVPKYNPFPDLVNYEVSSVSYTIDGEKKDCFYENTLSNYYPMNVLMGTYIEGMTIPEFVAEYNLVEKEPVPLPEPPTKEGHTFAGWYYDAEYTRPYDGDPITADTTLYAKFTVNSYTVTFDSIGGSACDPVTVDWNTMLADLPTPTKEGYDFMGWYIGETEYDGGVITANITLTAKWQIKVYTVTFMVGNDVYKTIEVEHGTTFYEAMKRAGMQYYNLLTAEGEKDGKGGHITESVTVYAAEMTKEEKAAQFWADNTWLLWSGLGLIGVLVLALSAAIAVAVKKG